MSRILRFFVCLGTLFFASNALAAGYSCSSLPKYLSCQHGYYMTSSQSSTTYNGTPKVGNYCQPCSRMGSNYTCAGGTAAPVQAAGGYTCPTYMKYTNCSVGYYMTDSSTSTVPDGNPKVRNACRPCSVYGANYTCAGGTAAPQAIKINVTCPKGQYLPQGATSCTTCPVGSFCPGQTCNGVSLVTGATSACGLSSCSTSTGALYPNSASGSSSINDCYLTLSTTKMVGVVNGGMVDCAAGYYCVNGGRNIYYDSNNEERGLTDSRPTIGGGEACARGSISGSTGWDICRPCPDGTTSPGTGTSSPSGCNITCSNSANVAKWVTPTWTPNYVSNLCKIDSCVACTKGTGVASCSASIVNNACTYTATCASGYKNPTCNGSSCSCEISTYTVTLNATANGGTGGTSVVYQMPGTGWYSDAAATNAISSITMPTKTNSVFNGYYSAQSGGTRYITNAGALPSNTPFSSNTTLYAQYSAASCNVTNGSATMSISGNKVSCAVTCNTGYSQSGGTNATTSFTVTGAVGAASVSASCSPRTFTVSLMDYDGTSTHGTIYEKYATGWYSDAAATKAITSITMPTKTNSVFNGYYSAQSGGTRYITDDGALPSSNTTFTANTTLYAQYSAAGCNVTHGSATMSISGNAVSCYVTCDTGYSMNGGTDTTTIFTEGGSVGQAWVTSKCFARTSTVSFNANGGTGGQSANATAKYDSAMPSISTTAPTRTGYTFMGWYDNATYTSGTQYYTAAGASARTWNKVADATLYAGWKVNSYTCTAGQYLKAGATACTTCTANSWCGGGTFSFNSGTDQGLNACPSDYSYSDAGTSSENNCYKNATNTGSQIAPALPTGCAAQTVIACHPDKCWYRIYKSGTTTSCTPTNCNQTHKACTSASKNYYLASGVAKSCSSADASYPSSDGGDIAASSCYGTFSKTGSQVNGSVPTGCASVTSWNACTPGTCQYTKYASGTVKTDCTPTNCTKTVKSVTASAKYYANGASCSACPSGYPNSADGNSGGITACYSNSKSRAWTGSQVNGSTPTNCYSVTSWNACSLPACSYVAYSNSTGNGDGTIKSGCSTNNDNCTKTPAAVTAKTGYRTNGTSCTACPSGYPNSADGNSGGVTACYSNSKSRAWTGSQVNGSTPTNCYSVTSWNACSLPACSYVAYSNSSGNGDGTIKSGCSTNNANCTKTVAAVTAKSGYYVSGTSCTLCSELAGGMYPNSDNDNTGGASACRTNSLSGQVIATPNASSATQCVAGTFKAAHTVNYGGTSSCGVCGNNQFSDAGAASCTGCKTANGYTNSGTTAESHAGVASCKATCAAGTYVATAGSACTTVGTGYWGAGGTVSQNTTLGRNQCPEKYRDGAAATQKSDCAVQTTAGKYIATAKATEQTKCPAKNYCPSASVKYGATNSPTACPTADATTARTTYPDDYLNPTRLSINNQGWSTGLPAITSCSANYSFTNAAGNFSVESVGYNATTGKYENGGGKYYTLVNAGWYLVDKYSETYCNTSTNRMYYHNVAECTANSYCPGYKSMPLCSTGTHNDEMGRFACSDLGNGYNYSPAKSGAETACYLTTSNSKFVAAAGAAEGACTAGGWCPGGVRVNYGSTGGRNTCPTKYPSSAASSNSELDCYVTTAAGKYVATVGAGQVNCAGTGYYCPGGTNVYSGAYGSRLTTGGRTQCPAGYRDLVATASTTKEAQCTMNVAGGKYVATAKESAASGTCAAGYAKAAHSVTYGNTSSCAACTGTTYAENTGQASCTACPTQSGVTNISYWISTGTHTDAKGCYGFYNDVALNNGSVARIQCFWDKTKSQYDTSCGAMKDGLKCNAAYYNAILESSPTNNAAYYTDKASVIAKACTSVGKGYWSPADVYTRTQCPAGYRDGAAGASEAQCTMNVAGGKYVAKANESVASGTCVAGYAKAAHSVTYGNTSSCAACTGATYAASTGQATCTTCPTAKTYASAVKSYGYWNNGKDGDHTISDGCYATMTGTLSNGSLTEHGCYLGTDGDYGNGGGKRCYVHQDNLKCNAGYYASTLSNGYVWNNTRAGLLGNTCVGVGAGYYSAANILTRNQCPTGLTTIGYGAGADEVTDCGRILHFGNDKLYLRSGKKTTPSLNVKIGDTTYYGNMTAGTGKGKLRLRSGTTTYSVHDDSM